MEYRATRRAHTTSAWAPDFTLMQRKSRGPGITEWRVTLSANFPHFDLKSEATTFSQKDISAAIRADVM
jgi:hypothetical protein